MMGAICNALCRRNAALNGTHCVIFTLNPRTPALRTRGYRLKAINIHTALMYTSVLRFTKPDTRDRQLLLDWALYTAEDRNDPAFWHCLSLVILRLGKKRRVTLGITHPLSRQYNAWTNDWRRLSLLLLNRMPVFHSEPFIRQSRRIYDSFSASFITS